jgi:hypothetical protein
MVLYNDEGCYANERLAFYCDYDDLSTQNTRVLTNGARFRRCVHMATRTVDFVENGSVRSIYGVATLLVMRLMLAEQAGTRVMD